MAWGPHTAPVDRLVATTSSTSTPRSRVSSELVKVPIVRGRVAPGNKFLHPLKRYIGFLTFLCSLSFPLERALESRERQYQVSGHCNLPGSRMSTSIRRNQHSCRVSSNLINFRFQLGKWTRNRTNMHSTIPRSD